MPDRRAAGLVASICAVAIAFAGCGGSARAATTYETWQYEVAIPDDLGLTPLNPDPVYVWAHPETTFATTTSATQLDFEVRPTAICDAGAMLALAQQLETASSAGVGTDPIQMTFGPAPGAMFTRTGTGVDVALAVACMGPSSVIALVSGLKTADVQAVMASFRFRDPPGDPAHPPTPAPSR